MSQINGRNGQEPLAQTQIVERPSGKVTAKKLRELLGWQDGRCALTGRMLEPSTCEVDHIDSLSEGGENCMENIQLVVSEANRAKNTMTQEQFIQLCSEVEEWAGQGHRGSF